jgi:hypothetical protein
MTIMHDGVGEGKFTDHYCPFCNCKGFSKLASKEGLSLIGKCNFCNLTCYVFGLESRSWEECYTNWLASFPND